MVGDPGRTCDGARLLPPPPRGEGRSAAVSEGPTAAGPKVVVRWIISSPPPPATRCDWVLVHGRGPNFRVRRLDAAFPVENAVHYEAGSHRQMGKRYRATAVHNKRSRLAAPRDKSEINRIFGALASKFLRVRNLLSSTPRRN